MTSILYTLGALLIAYDPVYQKCDQPGISFGDSCNDDVCHETFVKCWERMMFQSAIDLINRTWIRLKNWLGFFNPEQNSQIDSRFILGSKGDYDRELKELDMDAKASGFNDCCNCVVTDLLGNAITSMVIRIAACKKFQNRHREILVDSSAAATCKT